MMIVKLLSTIHDIDPSERDFEEIKERFMRGYKPYSSWFEGYGKET